MSRLTRPLDDLVPSPRGILFDYGNTLIPFGRREMDGIGAALADFVAEEIPAATPARIRAALDDAFVSLHRHRVATNEETDTRDVIRMAFRALGARAGEEDHVPRGLETVRRAFVAAVEPGPRMHEVLDALTARGIRLGIVSNYSLAAAIHDSLGKLGVRDRFDTVVVSAELGVVKPHPTIFHEAVRRLGLPPEEILFVGDNPRADLAGAVAAGMRTAWVTEHLDGAYHFEHPEENLAEVEPDLVLERLSDLLGRE